MIDIGNAALTARIAPLGAELVSLRDSAGRELMTDADPAFWTGHAPILFPIVGRLQDDAYRVDGVTYALPQHGFARRRDFAVVAQGDDHVRLRLEDDEATRAVYPFAFVLEVEHRLDGKTLTTAVTVTNRDGRDLPASIGFHPAYAWPLPYGHDRAAHRILFAADEPGGLSAIAGNGTIAEAQRDSPLDGRTLALTDDLFAHDALVWDPVRSRSVLYGAPDGPQLRVDYPELARLGIWSKPGARFVCIEPWDGIADPQGFGGDIFDKPGIHRVAPGASHRAAMSVTLEE